MSWRCGDASGGDRAKSAACWSTASARVAKETRNGRPQARIQLVELVLDTRRSERSSIRRRAREERPTSSESRARRDADAARRHEAEPPTSTRWRSSASRSSACRSPSSASTSSTSAAPPSSQADAAPAGRGGKRRGRGGGGARRRAAAAQQLMDAAVASLVASPPPPAGACGDGRCEPPETPDNCMADCPGVTTPPQCGEEPHSDVGGSAVVWGASHKKDSAAQCCDACAAHAADPKNARKPCNSWVFCYTYPQCWSLDTGQLARLRRVLAQASDRPEEPAVRPARRLHRRVPAEARQRAQDGAQPRRHAAQPLGADARAVDGGRDVRGPPARRPQRQVVHRPRGDDVVDGCVDRDVARVGVARAEPRARRRPGDDAATSEVESPAVSLLS